MRKAFVRPALAAALLVTSASAADAARYTERFERVLPAGDAVEVRLTNTNGSVTVETWEQASVEIVAEKSLDSRSPADAKEVFDQLEIIVRDSDGRIEIETRQPRGSDGFFDWLFGRSRNASVRYQLRVPLGAELDVRTVNGSVTTEGAGGHQLLRSTNGRITVKAAQESVEAHTTNGSIQVELIAAPARLDVDLGSTNGSITLALPRDAGGRIAARTVNGSVRSELPLTIEGTVSRKRLSGELGAGGPGSIDLRTTNGSIRINRSTL